jgi:hypothetical protein|nr:MAG TPA: hypothetical protein [Caudoviricetes sp.]
MLELEKEYTIITICDRKILVNVQITYKRFLELVMDGNWQIADIFEYSEDTIIAVIEPVSQFVN